MMRKGGGLRIGRFTLDVSITGNWSMLMRGDVILFLVGILSQVAQLLIGVSQGNADLTHFSVLSLSLLVVVFCGFWLISSRQTRQITEELAKRLPAVAVIRGATLINRELTRIASQASEYIYATGSAARDVGLLAEIEKRVMTAGVSYSRILYKRHMKPQLKDHLKRLQGTETVRIGSLPEAHYGYYFITRTEAVIVVPNVVEASMIGLLFEDAERISILRQAFEQLSADAIPVHDAAELEALYSELQSFGQ